MCKSACALGCKLINSFFLAIILLSGGCEELDHEGQQIAKDHIQSVQYFYDPRTNLCFAGLGVSLDSGSITNVPCSPEVIKLLVK
jgi:hypothetical protein